MQAESYEMLDSCWLPHSLYSKTGSVCLCVRNVTLRRVRVTVGCCRKAIRNYYMFWVCVCSFSYPARTVHAPYRRLWPVRLYVIFPHCLVNVVTFGKKLLNIKCVSWFSVQLLFKTFLILRRDEPDSIISVHKTSSEVPVTLTWF